MKLRWHTSITRSLTGAPCDRACVTGTLALVARLRRAFPGLVLVMQNATSATTRRSLLEPVAAWLARHWPTLFAALALLVGAGLVIAGAVGLVGE